MSQELEQAKRAVLQRMESYEAQGTLPMELNSVLAHLALFDDLGSAGDAALAALCNEGVLVHDRATDQLDIKRRLERLLKD